LKQRILIIGASPFLNTGYSKITKELAETLSMKEDYLVLVSAFLWTGALHQVGKYFLLPCYVNPGMRYDPIALAMLHIERYRPTTVIQVGDLFVFQFLEKRYPWIRIAYFPLDAKPFPPRIIGELDKIDIRVTTSKFSRQQIRDVKREAFYIYHGVNCNSFLPLDERSKQEARAYYEAPKHKVIIGMVAQNTFRKQIPRLIEAFTRVKRKRKEILLWLHTTPYDPTGFELPDILHYYGLREGQDYRFTPWVEKMSLSQQELVTLYNIFDIHALPSSGEGFGIPTLESMACGVVNIGPDYAATPEVIGDTGRLTPIEYYITDKFGQKRGMVSISKLEEQLIELIENPSLRKELGEKSRLRAYNFDISRFQARWLNLLQNIESVFT